MNPSYVVPPIDAAQHEVTHASVDRLALAARQALSACFGSCDRLCQRVCCASVNIRGKVLESPSARHIYNHQFLSKVISDKHMHQKRKLTEQTGHRAGRV